MPVYSPLSFVALLNGFAALVSPARATRACAEVEAWARRDDANRDVLLLDSGTSALSLALRATAGERGRPVAIPAFACYDIATAVDGAGVPFVFYDIDPSTLGPDFASLRRALEAGADRVVLVHLYGVPVDLDLAGSLAREYGALLIEDAAQGSGGGWDGRTLGASGSLGILSFGRGKGITGGTGGALLANDARGRAALATARTLTGPGRTSLREVVALLAQWLLARRWLYWLPAALPFLGLGETTYRAPRPAARISAFACGVLRGTVRESGREEGIRRANAAALLARIAPQVGAAVAVPPRGVAGYLRLPLLSSHADVLSTGGDRSRLGVMRSYPRPLTELRGFGARASGGGATFPGAQELSARLITIPVHSRLARVDLTCLEAWLAR